MSNKLLVSDKVFPNIDEQSFRSDTSRRGPTARELRHWAALARALVERGWGVHRALAAAWEQVCLHVFLLQPHWVCHLARSLLSRGPSAIGMYHL